MQFSNFLLVILMLIACDRNECRGVDWQDNDMELLQTHVIFRHGERTTYKFYPNDAHINRTFHPIGLGGLTNNGKLGEYKLGQFLRKEYKTFLSEIYSDLDVEVRSTNTIRTIMSAQLVLAGLYPPPPEQMWHPELHWQPIPVLSKPEEDLLHPEVCPKKLAYYDSLVNNEDIARVYIKPYEKLFRFIEDKSGMPIRSPHDLLEFYFIVSTEDEMHLTLPSWIREIYPDQIYPVASLTYSFLNSDNSIKQINAGYLMKKIIGDAVNMTEGSHENVKKMYLYSGHESTLGFLLYAMDLLKPHIPPYGSAILIELHRNKEGKFFMKVKYRNSPIADTAIDLTLPGCDGQVYCPLKKFIELQHHYLPTLSVSEACKLAAAN